VNAEALVAMQDLDLEADRLRAERAGLPARAELEQCAADRLALQTAREQARVGRAELEREERRLEGEVAEVADKVRRVGDDLYSGRVSAAKELEALQTELGSFQRRQAELEEEELAVMEKAEAADSELAGLDEREREIDARVESLRQSLASDEARLDGQLGDLVERRSAAAAPLPEDTLVLYQRLRGIERLAGRVAVPLRDGKTCSGCRVSLPISDASRIRNAAADQIVQCPRCTRILLC